MPRVKKSYVELCDLKGIITARGSSQRKLAALLSIGQPTFSHKINGISSFDSAEIDKLATELNISYDDIGYIFFPHRRSKARRVS